MRRRGGGWASTVVAGSLELAVDWSAVPADGRLSKAERLSSAGLAETYVIGESWGSSAALFAAACIVTGDDDSDHAAPLPCHEARALGVLCSHMREALLSVGRAIDRSVDDSMRDSLGAADIQAVRSLLAELEQRCDAFVATHAQVRVRVRAPARAHACVHTGRAHRGRRVERPRAAVGVVRAARRPVAGAQIDRSTP